MLISIIPIIFGIINLFIGFGQKTGTVEWAFNNLAAIIFFMTSIILIEIWKGKGRP